MPHSFYAVIEYTQAAGGNFRTRNIISYPSRDSFEKDEPNPLYKVIASGPRSEDFTHFVQDVPPICLLTAAIENAFNETTDPEFVPAVLERHLFRTIAVVLMDRDYRKIHGIHLPPVDQELLQSLQSISSLTVGVSPKSHLINYLMAQYDIFKNDFYPNFLCLDLVDRLTEVYLESITKF